MFENNVEVNTAITEIAATQASSPKAQRLSPPLLQVAILLLWGLHENIGKNSSNSSGLKWVVLHKLW